jgi:hypothetical protein
VEEARRHEVADVAERVDLGGEGGGERGRGVDQEPAVGPTEEREAGLDVEAEEPQGGAVAPEVRGEGRELRQLGLARA